VSNHRSGDWLAATKERKKKGTKKAPSNLENPGEWRELKKGKDR